MFGKDIEIKLVEGMLEVVTPYHPELPDLFRDLGGKWDGDEFVGVED